MSDTLRAIVDRRTVLAAAASAVLGAVFLRLYPIPGDAAPLVLAIPERGLFTGIAIVGAIGTGKTSGCMYSYADQLLGSRASDPAQKIGGLVLEVKGDFCYKLRELMARHGRGDDYLEISLDAPYRYNPLHNDLEAYALAYGIASLLNNLFGRGEEPFWQQAFTNLVKFIILLHKVVDDYVTLFDVYESAINPDRIAERLAVGERRLSESGVAASIEAAHLDTVPGLRGFAWVRDPSTGRMLTELTPAVQRRLEAHDITFTVETREEDRAPFNRRRFEQFAAVRRWFQHDWMRIEPKLRTSIVEGIEVILPFLRPIEHLILDPQVTEIMVNGAGPIFIERDGRLEPVAGVTLREQSLQVAIRNMARALGDDISEEKPLLDSPLPDGSRVAAVFPPCSLGGTTLTIRKFQRRLFTVEELVRIGTLTQEMVAGVRQAMAR